MIIASFSSSFLNYAFLNMKSFQSKQEKNKVSIGGPLCGEMVGGFGGVGLPIGRFGLVLGSFGLVKCSFVWFRMVFE